VPVGIGATRIDSPEGRSLRFAPPTPPWRRQAPNEEVEESHISDLARAAGVIYRTAITALSLQ
jgi:hypothetical protein